MRLHSAAWERRLRQRVRAVVRGVPALRREFRKNRRARRTESNLLAPVFRIGALLLIVGAAGSRGCSVEAQLGLVTLWAVFGVVAHAAGWLQALYAAPDLYALFGLPVSDRQILRWEAGKHLRSSSWVAIEFLAGYGMIRLTWDSWSEVWQVVPAAFVQAATVLGVALALAAWRPSHLYRGAAVVIWLFLFALVILHEFVGEQMFAALEWTAPTLNRLLPVGWISLHVLDLGRGAWQASLFPLGVAAGVALLAARSGWHRLQHAYVLNEAAEPPKAEIESALEEVEAAQAPAEEDLWATTGPGPTEIMDALRSRQFLASPLGWDEGWLERWFSRGLSPRARTVWQFMQMGTPRWSRHWQLGSIVLACGFLLGLAIQNVVPAYRDSVWFHYLLVGLWGGLLVLPASSGLSRAFQGGYMSGVTIPLRAGYPVGYWETGRLVLRSVCLRFLAGAPILALYGGLVFWALGQPPLWGFGIGLKVSWMAFALRPAMIAMRFSRGTNDSARLAWSALLFVLAAATAGILLLGLGVAAFALSGAWAWAIALLFPLPSLAFYGFYGWLYNRFCFDLMQSTPT